MSGDGPEAKRLSSLRTSELSQHHVSRQQSFISTQSLMPANRNDWAAFWEIIERTSSSQLNAYRKAVAVSRLNDE